MTIRPKAQKFPISIDQHAADAKSRLVLVALSTMTLRVMEEWRNLLSSILGSPPDYDTTMIIGAMVSIAAEKLMRAQPAPPLHSLETVFPQELLTKCNVASLAAATGLNRETTRRKVHQLIQQGFFIKAGDGVRFAHGLLQLPIIRHTLQRQLETLRRTLNKLGELGVAR